MTNYLNDVFYTYQQARTSLLQRTGKESNDEEDKFSKILIKTFESRENPRRILRVTTNVSDELTRHPHTYLFETIDDGSLIVARYDDETELCKRLDISPYRSSVVVRHRLIWLCCMCEQTT